MIDYDGSKIILSGDWRWMGINETLLLERFHEIIPAIRVKNIAIKDNATNLDTTGCYMLMRLIELLKKHGCTVELDFVDNHKRLMELMLSKSLQVTNVSTQNTNPLVALGAYISEFIGYAICFLSFIGAFCINIVQSTINPKTVYWQELLRTVHLAGVQGIWVTSSLCFLLGMTLAYQMSPQFVTYGANVFIVNFLGIALLKEVTPLLAAIIFAGRTGAAITAEIGTMQIQEELDALRTMGISLFRRLVLPKVLGSMIALPLTTVVADILSMTGGAIVANNYLNVDYVLFIERTQSYVSIHNYTCGIIKSFVFALCISLIGCFCGFNVKGNANSIGEQTTTSVVMSIVFIIAIDALFAIVYKILGI